MNAAAQARAERQAAKNPVTAAAPTPGPDQSPDLSGALRVVK